MHDDVTLQDVAVATSWENVSILPSSANLSGVVKHLDGEVGGHLILKEKLAASDVFDVIFIDTSPSLNILVINALCASDYLFIPLSSKFFSMQGLAQTLGSFDKIKGRLNPDLRLSGIAFVNHDKRNVLANEVVQQVTDKYGDLLFSRLSASTSDRGSAGEPAVHRSVRSRRPGRDTVPGIGPGITGTDRPGRTGMRVAYGQEDTGRYLIL
jgi:chromosome partitioning protein